jgi:hypothetical protein
VVVAAVLVAAGGATGERSNNRGVVEVNNIQVIGMSHDTPLPRMSSWVIYCKLVHGGGDDNGFDNKISRDNTGFENRINRDNKLSISLTQVCGRVMCM